MMLNNKNQNMKILVKVSQQACINNVSGTGLNGHSIPRNLFHFSCVPCLDKIY